MSHSNDSEAAFLARYDSRAHAGPLATVDLAIFTLASASARPQPTPAAAAERRNAPRPLR